MQICRSWDILQCFKVNSQPEAMIFLQAATRQGSLSFNFDCIYLQSASSLNLQPCNIASNKIGIPISWFGMSKIIGHQCEDNKGKPHHKSERHDVKHHGASEELRMKTEIMYGHVLPDFGEEIR